jgi:membrane associated rhomboid family serine protease
MSGYQAGVAHFAHLGGMIWGFALLWWWKKQRKIYF